MVPVCQCQIVRTHQSSTHTAARMTLTPRPRSARTSAEFFSSSVRTELADAAGETIAEDGEGRIARDEAAERVALNAGLDEVDGRDRTVNGSA